MRIPYISILLFFFFLVQTSAKKSYIVYLGGSQKFGKRSSIFDVQLAKESQFDILGSVLDSKVSAKDSLIYSYSKYINGFAAMLNEQQAIDLEKNPSVVSVFENRIRHLHTTRSWNFLGMENDAGIPPNSIWNAAKFGEDTIIGNLDSGVWPESKSFDDTGYGPVPERWTGECDGGTNFTCNKKLIGARFFYQGLESAKNITLNTSMLTARDQEGHGTHTLSTAGGNLVPGANVFGSGNGTAKGGSPRARVVAYKVCWPGGCSDADILAAFEAAIGDGVDVLSVSLGSRAMQFATDPVSVASFHAVQQGIVVVCSAGNSGPDPATVANIAPWMFTVAASTIDRDFVSYVELGNKKKLKGSSLSSEGLPAGNVYPLINAVEAKAATVPDGLAKLCEKDSLDPTKAKGKIVVCLGGDDENVEQGFEVRRAGGVGLIIVNNEEDGADTTADPHFLPASHVSFEDGLLIAQYMNSTQTPVAFISDVKTEVGIKPSPVMAAFSSRGPNPIEESMIKPDITAPGVTIIASMPEVVAASRSSLDTRRVPFNILSGTSMACPHISGIAGLLRTLNPTWSPAAIKSAMMTTAITVDNTNHSMLSSNKADATPFDCGAGYVQPNNAMDPGLVYDTTIDDYLNFLCAKKYTEAELKKFSNQKFVCTNSSLVTDLNYPSIAIPKLVAGTPVTINRRLMNVGSPGTYVAQVKVPPSVAAKVEPSSLQFSKVDEEKTFKVVFQHVGKEQRLSYEFGTLEWSDGKHFVRSPIAFMG